MPLAQSSPGYQTRRAAPVETTIYEVEADVVGCQLMPDGDYRVEIRGASGESLYLEMPDPQFVDPQSPFAYAMKAARDQLEEKLHPERKPQTVLAHARVAGIGFFSRAYGKNAKPAGNLLQLHPVLEVAWLEKPTAQFAAERKKKEDSKR